MSLRMDGMVLLMLTTFGYELKSWVKAHKSGKCGLSYVHKHHVFSFEKNPIASQMYFHS
jgi:hypothetical protein